VEGPTADPTHANPVTYEETLLVSSCKSFMIISIQTLESGLRTQEE